MESPSLNSRSQYTDDDVACRLLSRDQCFLVVVDIQEKLLAPIAGQDAFLRNCRLLIQLAGILQLPVLVSTQYAKALGETVSAIRELLPEIQPIEKLQFGCFCSEEFVTATKRLPGSRTTMLLCGMETHICIMQTALGGLNRGYNVHVASDAVVSRDEWNWQIGLERMQRAGALISSTEMMIYELLGGAGTPEFKAMLKHLKD